MNPVGLVLKLRREGDGDVEASRHRREEKDLGFFDVLAQSRRYAGGVHGHGAADLAAHQLEVTGRQAESLLGKRGRSRDTRADRARRQVLRLCDVGECQREQKNPTHHVAAPSI